MTVLQTGGPERIFLELKRSSGFDVVGEGLSYQAFIRQYQWTKRFLFGTDEPQAGSSVYEVGCGSGANLFLFEQEGIACGGIDYSRKLSLCRGHGFAGRTAV